MLFVWGNLWTSSIRYVHLVSDRVYTIVHMHDGKCVTSILFGDIFKHAQIRTCKQKFFKRCRLKNEA